MRLKASSSSKKITLVAIGIVAAVGVSAFASYWFLQVNAEKTTPQSVISTQSKVSPKVKTDQNTLRFAAMGDMLAHDSVTQNAKTASGYDFGQFFSKIKPLYSDADVVFCNPETPVAPAFAPSGYPTFNAPPEFARDLVDIAGCNVINLATNHINDKGQAGIEGSIQTWREHKLLALHGANVSPEEQTGVSYFTKNGIKVAFVAFMDFSNDKTFPAYAINTYHDTALVTKLLTEARQNADAVIVSAHWGVEDSSVVSNDQIAAAQRFSDLGADVIIGTGPHVLQKVDTIENASGHKTLVWYSIGNMLSTQLEINQLTSGVAEFTLRKDDQKITISDLAFQPTFMSYSWPAADRAVEKLSTRSDLMLMPLKDAESQLSAMFPGHTYAERTQYLKNIFGSDSMLASP